jgi:small subunit ribosomal protein S20
LANTKSALKARRVAERRHERNRAVRSALRTYVKKARASVSGTPDEDATARIKEAAKHLDQAASKGIIHKNQAARRKSRLMRQLAAVQQSGPAEAAKPRTRRTTTRTGTTRTGTTRSTSTRTRTTRASS